MNFEMVVILEPIVQMSCMTVERRSCPCKTVYENVAGSFGPESPDKKIFLRKFTQCLYHVGPALP